MVCSINQMTAVSGDLADLVGTRICGPSCVAMALQILDRYPKTERKDNVEWLLARLAILHKSNVEMICYRTIMTGKEVDIPVDVLTNMNKYLLEEKGFILKEADDIYQPIFSLVRGYDHRGSERLFGTFGLKAGYWEKLELKDLISKVQEGSLALLSVIPRRPATRNLVISKCEPTKSHVVLVTKIEEKGGENSYQIMDPAYDLKQGLEPIYILSENELKERLNWRGSWIKKIS